MGRLALFVGLVTILGSASAGTADAALILDQAISGPFGIIQGVGGVGVGGSEINAAQTFTVGVEGILDSVDVFIVRTDPGTVLGIDMVAQIFSAAGDLPVGSALATLVIPEASLPAIPNVYTFFNIDFSSFGIPMIVGNEMAIVLSDNNSVSQNTLYGWQGCGPASCYAGGEASLEIGGAGFVHYGSLPVYFPILSPDLYF